MAHRRSPLREPPLRVAGQSGDEGIQRLLVDESTLNPKMLPGYVKREPITLPEEDVKLAVYCLARHIRMDPAAGS